MAEFCGRCFNTWGIPAAELPLTCQLCWGHWLVLQRKYLRGEQDIVHRYPVPLPCTRIIFFHLHEEQWECVAGPHLLVKSKRLPVYRSKCSVPLLIPSLCLGVPFPADSMQRNSMCGWSRFGFLSLVLAENLTSSLASTCSPSPFETWGSGSL